METESRNCIYFILRFYPLSHISTTVLPLPHIDSVSSKIIRFTCLLPFHMSEHLFAKEFSPSIVHDSGTRALLIPEIHPLYQYSIPGSKHTSSKLLSLPIGSFRSPRQSCLVGFDHHHASSSFIIKTSHFSTLS